MAEFKIAEAFVEVTTRDNTASGEARIRSKLGRIRATANVDVDVDTGSIRRAEVAVTAAGRGIERAMSRAGSSGSQLGRIGISATKLVGTLGAVVGAAGAAGAAIAAIPAAGAAAAGMLGVLVGSFNGVGDALKGHKTDQEAAQAAMGATGQAAASNARQIRDAQQGIADARRNQARAAKDATDAIADAEQEQARVARDTAEQIADAKRDEARVARDVADDVNSAREDQVRVAEQGAQAIADASERVQNALDDERSAQEDLTDARADAAAQLADLQEKVSDYALDQEGAAIRVLKAEEKLAEVMADATATDLDRRDAQHDLAVAQERVSDLAREQAQDAASLADAQAKGIDGSDRVVSAQERLADAHKATIDAQNDLTRTQADAAKANQDATKAVAQAISEGAERQQEAARNTARVEREAAEARADAADRVRDAIESGAQAQEDAAMAVADAMQNLSDVQASQAESATAGAAASHDYADAMAKLTPAGRAFVEQLLRMDPLVKGLRDASQEAFLPGLTQMLRDSEGLFPIFHGFLTRTGTIMGETAIKAGQMFKSDEFKANLEATFRASEPITRAIGDGLVNLTGRLIQFGAEMAPASAGFAHFIDSTVSALSGFMDKLAPHADSFKRIWEALGKILEVVLPVLGDVIGQLADKLAPALEGLSGFLERNKDHLDEWALGIGAFLLALKGAKIVGDVSTWTKGVIDLFDKVGTSAATNKGKVEEFGDSTGRRGKGGKPGRKGGKAGVVAGVVGGAVVGGAVAGAGGDGGGGSKPGDIGDAADTATKVLSLDLSGLFEKLKHDVEVFPEEVSAAGKRISVWFQGLREDIGRGWDWLGEKLDVLKGVFGRAWDWMGEKLSAVKAATIDPVLEGLKLGTQWVGEKFEWLQGAAGRAWDWIGEKLSAVKAATIDPVTEGIRTATQWVGEKFEWLRGVAGTVWDWIGQKLDGVKTGVIDPVFGAIKLGTQWVGDKFEWLRSAAGIAWDWIGEKLRGVKTGVIDPVYEGLKSATQWVGDKFEWLRGLTGQAWDWIGQKLQWVNANVVQPVGAAIRDASQWVGDKFEWLRGAAGVAWDWIGAKLRGVNEAVLQPAMNAIRTGAQWVAEKFEWLRVTAGGIWDWIGQKIGWVRDNIVGPIFTGLNNAVDGVGRAFQNTADWIGRSWDSIKEKARQPAQWVIDVVYNRGIRPVWNGIANVFGGAQLGDVRMARGGLVPGEDRGYDYVPALLRGGEGVLVPEAVRMVGGSRGLEQLNRDAERQRFAAGGVVGGFAGASGSGSSQVSSFWDRLWAGPVAAVRGLFDGVFTDNARTPGAGNLRGSLMRLPGIVVDKIVAKAKAWIDNVGSVGAGSGGSGVQRWSGVVAQALGMMGQPQSHAGSTLRRMNQESGGNPNIVNRWDSNWLRGTPSVGLMQVIGPTYRANRDVRRDVGPYLYGTSVDPLSNVLSSMHYALRRYGSLPAAYDRKGGYDQGGIAQGVGYLPKYTPAPERVLSPQQTVAFDRFVEWLDATSTTTRGGSGDRPVNVNVTQVSGSPAETGRFVALALRSVG